MSANRTLTVISSTMLNITSIYIMSVIVNCLNNERYC